MMQATPATWRMLLEAGWHGDPGLKILFGGEALSRKLATSCAKIRLVWNMYGPTETTIWSTISKLEPGQNAVIDWTADRQHRDFHPRQVLQPVPIGVAGELHIGGHGLGTGLSQTS